MDTINLPRISMDLTPRQALNRMYEEGAHAVVAESKKNEFVILMNHDLVTAAESSPDSRLDKLKVPARRARPLLQFAGETEADTEASLDEMGTQFGVAERDDDFVMVVTRHETLAYEIRSAPPICRCVGNFHSAEIGQKKCRFDNTDIRCY
jgi:hypothetical protein